MYSILRIFKLNNGQKQVIHIEELFLLLKQKRIVCMKFVRHLCPPPGSGKRKVLVLWKRAAGGSGPSLESPPVTMGTEPSLCESEYLGMSRTKSSHTNRNKLTVWQDTGLLDWEWQLSRIKLHYKHEQTFRCMYISFLVSRVDGPVLELHKVKKSEAGSYLCIASNGHPPTVSRRVQLDVKCKFKSHVSI